MIYDPCNLNHFKFNHCIFLTPAFQTKDTDETNLNKATRGFRFVIQTLSAQFPVFQATRNSGGGVGLPRPWAPLRAALSRSCEGSRCLGTGAVWRRRNRGRRDTLTKPRAGRAEAGSSGEQGSGRGPHTRFSSQTERNRERGESCREAGGGPASRARPVPEPQAPSLLDSWRPRGPQAPGPWGSPGKSTGGGCRFLLQRIFPTQGSNPGLPRFRQILYRLRYQGTVRTTTRLRASMRNGFPTSFKQGVDSAIKGWRSRWSLSHFANADALRLVSAGGASPGHQRLRLGRWTLEPSSCPILPWRGPGASV